MITLQRLLNQVVASAMPRQLAVVLVAGLASCGGPAKPEAGTDQAVTLPATAAGRDSVKEALAAPAPDAASTSADSTAGRSTVTPR